MYFFTCPSMLNSTLTYYTLLSVILYKCIVYLSMFLRNPTIVLLLQFPFLIKYLYLHLHICVMHFPINLSRPKTHNFPYLYREVIQTLGRFCCVHFNCICSLELMWYYPQNFHFFPILLGFFYVTFFSLLDCKLL